MLCTRYTYVYRWRYTRPVLFSSLLGIIVAQSEKLEQFDSQQFTIPGPLPTVSSSRAPRHRPGQAFLLGPVPMAWLAQAAMLPGRALFVGILVWHLAGLQGRRQVKWQPKRARLYGIERHVTYRALKALEGAGLLCVFRQRGRSPEIAINEIKN